MAHLHKAADPTELLLLNIHQVEHI